MTNGLRCQTCRRFPSVLVRTVTGWRCEPCHERNTRRLAALLEQITTAAFDRH